MGGRRWRRRGGKDPAKISEAVEVAKKFAAAKLSTFVGFASANGTICEELSFAKANPPEEAQSSMMTSPATSSSNRRDRHR